MTSGDLRVNTSVSACVNYGSPIGRYTGQTGDFHPVFTRFSFPGSQGMPLFPRLRYTMLGLSGGLAGLSLVVRDQNTDFAYNSVANDQVKTALSESQAEGEE